MFFKLTNTLASAAIVCIAMNSVAFADGTGKRATDRLKLAAPSGAKTYA
jgi:hypothetical protein